jgi:DNA (cytosine-5)-methyltransferase 1
MNLNASPLAQELPLVLSLFPGIGLMDRAFEDHHFCVVRGPDRLWGGCVKSFHPPRGRFEGVIGGPPCQAHSGFAAINRAAGNQVAVDMIPEFVRVVERVQPEWFVMENAPAVPDVVIEGYVVQRINLDNRWLGQEQARRRVFQFGSRSGVALSLDAFGLEHPILETTCLASEGSAGRMTKGKDGKSVYRPRRDFGRFCQLQGLEPDFLDDAPFTIEGKFKVVGNGVPLPMGHAIASAVRAAMYPLRGNEERECGSCAHCGSLKDPFFSRVVPMGYHCQDCGKEWDSP